MNKTDRIVTALTSVRDLIRAVEGVLIDLVAAISPWLAPVIPAWMVKTNLSGPLGMPEWVAWIGAAVVELVGLSAVHTAFSLWDYNDSKRKSDQRAPVWVAAAMAVFYLAVVLIVNVALHPGTLVERLAVTLLSMLTAIAAVILAVRAGHARRLGEIQAERAERQRQRKAPETFRQVAAVPETTADWRGMLPEEKKKLSGMTSAQIVAEYGVTERTARNWRNRIAANGNGHK